MTTYEYLQQIPNWFAPGPIIVGLTYAVVVLCVWTAIWQYIHDNTSTNFYKQKNSWWAGLVLAVVGVAVFFLLAGPALIKVLKPLWRIETLIALGLTIFAIVVITLGIRAYRWSRSKA
jgi:hypothetical protein